MGKYLFKSERLGFRNWLSGDIEKMTAISADPEVMKYFPAPATALQTSEFVERMKIQFVERGHCYFAVELLESEKFIGFIGLMYQDFESEHTPFVDIGWRLDKDYWHMGYATEGALACLDYGFKILKLDRIYSTAPEVNKKSWRIMSKIGMTQIGKFIHPRLRGNARLESVVLYQINNPYLPEKRNG